MKSSVFNLRLNTDSDGDDETIGGKLLQTHAAATGNARSPIVERFDDGMTSAAVFADRSRLRESSSSTRLSSAEKVYGILSETRNRWRPRSNGVTWSYFRAEYIHQYYENDE